MSTLLASLCCLFQICCQPELELLDFMQERKQEHKYDRELMQAIDSNNENLLEKLLSEKSSVKDRWYRQGKWFMPLQAALARSHFEIFKMLVGAGYDVNVCDGLRGPTLLFYTEDFQKTQLLLAKGVNPKEKSECEETAFTHCFRKLDCHQDKMYLCSWAKLMLMATFDTPEKVDAELEKFFELIRKYHAWRSDKSIFDFLKKFNDQCILERKLLLKHKNYDCEFMYH